MQGATVVLMGLAGLAALVGCGTGVVVSQEIEEVNRDYLETSQEGKPDLSEAEQIIIDRTNQYRKEQGLEAVSPNDRLTDAARYFAAYMATTGEYGHHADGNRPPDRAAYFDYEYCIVSENIAMMRGARGPSTQELGTRFYDGWIDSPEHHENIVDQFVTETGVAVSHDPQSGTYYAVQMFGRPESASIRFQVINRSEQEVRYLVHGQGRKEETSAEYTIPPRGIRTHVRCRQPVLDWGWTDEAETFQAKGGTAYVIQQNGNGLSIEEGEMNARGAR